VLILPLALSSTSQASMRHGECGADMSFVSQEKIAKNEKRSNYHRVAYAEFASILAPRIGEGTTYCSYTGRNVVYFLRQALPARSGPVSHWPIDREAAGSVSMLMSLLFSSGRFGLPKDVQIAECWKSIFDGYAKCENLEKRKYGAVDAGVAPKGFRSMRKLLK
jgi:hypothetical protein